MHFQRYPQAQRLVRRSTLAKAGGIPTEDFAKPGKIRAYAVFY
jgi:hypothetical protein